MKTISTILGLIMFLLLSTFAGLRIYQIGHEIWPAEEAVAVDSTATEDVCGVSEDIFTTLFTSVDEVMMIHQDYTTKQSILTEFEKIPQKTIENVSNILLTRQRCIGISDIVTEYLTNRKIYDNIKENGVIKPGDPIPLATPPVVVSADSTNTNDSSGN